ncbi:hypothetical protein ACDP63_11350 [Paracoccus sp. P2]|uniref:hypothetical protein n=1 Tax=Paracoccus sp. P2 TaxID=3248840 RepID=UPI00391FB5C3
MPSEKAQRFTKKPVTVEAIQYTGVNLREVLDFTGKHPRWEEWFKSFEDYEAHVHVDRGAFKILTLEGTMEALPGDWIIRGVKGEHYPCKPDIFAATYIRADLCASGQQVRALEWEQVDPTAVLGHGIEPCQYYIRYEVGFWWMPGDAEVEDAQEFDDLEAAKAAAQADYERRILSALTPAPQPEGHHDDLAVDRFAAAMKAKLAKKRAEGRGGWERKDECSAEDLTYMLVQHLWKGDPLDVGNIAMMLHQRGDRIVLDGEAKNIVPQPEGEAVPVAWQAKGSDDTWRYVEMPKTARAVGMELRPLYATPSSAHPPQPSETVAEALKLAALSERVRVLEGALSDMVSVAEQDEWAMAMTGRQLILKAALRALKGSDQ